MNYLFIFIALIALIACSDKSNIDPSTTNDLIDKSGAGSVIPHTIELANQTLTVVPQSEFIVWVKAHKTAHIYSISSIAMGNYNNAVGYIIVWSSTVTTVEKSPKELALEKLTDADKKALGLIK
jgi:hypothetical protein